MRASVSDLSKLTVDTAYSSVQLLNNVGETCLIYDSMNMRNLERNIPMALNQRIYLLAPAKEKHSNSSIQFSYEGNIFDYLVVRITFPTLTRSHSGRPVSHHVFTGFTNGGSYNYPQYYITNSYMVYTTVSDKHPYHVKECNPRIHLATMEDICLVTETTSLIQIEQESNCNLRFFKNSPKFIFDMLTKAVKEYKHCHGDIKQLIRHYNPGNAAPAGIEPAKDMEVNHEIIVAKNKPYTGMLSLDLLN